MSIKIVFGLVLAALLGFIGWKDYEIEKRHTPAMTETFYVKFLLPHRIVGVVRDVWKNGI